MSGFSVLAAEEQSASTALRSVAASDPPRVMLMLGDFEFSIDALTYNQLSREASWRWSAQERIGQADLLQYTGKERRTVTLEGEAHAFFRKGMSAIDDLYVLADKATPLQLVSGAGDVLGYWVIEKFNDGTSKFLPAGTPRHKTFSIGIRHYGDNLSNP